jgi:hypothetical protein
MQAALVDLLTVVFTHHKIIDWSCYKNCSYVSVIYHQLTIHFHGDLPAKNSLLFLFRVFYICPV